MNGNNQMKKYAVIVAGGSGSRMGTQVPKQFLMLYNRPVLWYSLRAFLDAYEDLEIVLVLPEEHMETGKKLLASTQAPHRIRAVAGGATRFHSVKKGLDSISDRSIIFVHDGVRCLVTPTLIRRCFEKALETGNAIPAIRCVDSVRVEMSDGNRPLDRDTIRIIQTPQTFSSELIQLAFGQPYDESFTDEAVVVEKTGASIHLVEGEPTNIKITRPIDLVIAEKILGERSVL